MLSSETVIPNPPSPIKLITCEFGLDNFNTVSISVVCSRWDDPFGRTSLESSSRGCAVIISNKGGLPETVTNAKILKKLSVNSLEKSLIGLINDDN